MRLFMNGELSPFKGSRHFLLLAFLVEQCESPLPLSIFIIPRLSLITDILMQDGCEMYGSL